MFSSERTIVRLLELYKPYKNKIIIIQNCCRNYMNKVVNKLRGPGLFKRYLINNDTDFLTFEKCINIPNSEFFSYRDTDNFIYAFNIKSIKYLIENNQKNPYNRNNFTPNCIENLIKLIKKDENLGKDLSIKFNLHETPYTKMKNKCVKIFQRMDELELYTQPRWFLDLNISNLKKLYMEIEDIWNYRAMLNNEMKLNYTNNGKAFLYNVHQVNRIDDKLRIQNIILNEFEKFAFEGKTKDDCVTSCYWILTGLTIVSLDAASGCPELVLSNMLN